MKIAVLGSGAWGTALAASVAARHSTLLWARDAGQAAALGRDQCNGRYLPGVRLPDGLRFTADLAEALAHGQDGLIVIATPMAGLRSMLQVLPEAASALWLCKGFEEGSGALGHEVSRQARPGRPCGVLSGPSFALEVARADIDREVGRVRAKGVDVFGPVRLEWMSAESWYFYDPDGNLVEYWVRDSRP